ncbi:hypothetical protein ACFE04_028887 [Oxalis oulophora]
MKLMMANLLAIWNILYDFIAIIIARQALKRVTLGRGEACSLRELKVQPMPEELPNTLTDINEKEETPKEPRDVVIDELGKTQDEERSVKGKAPKKVVSINENVEEIYMSKESDRRRRKLGLWKVPSIQLQDDDKPLKSILKVSSSNYLTEELGRY